MIGWLSGRSSVEDAVQNEGLFTLQSFAQGTAARSPGGVLGDVKRHAIQFPGVHKLEKE